MSTMPEITFIIDNKWHRWSSTYQYVSNFNQLLGIKVYSLINCPKSFAYFEFDHSNKNIQGYTFGENTNNILYTMFENYMLNHWHIDPKLYNIKINSFKSSSFKSTFFNCTYIYGYDNENNKITSFYIPTCDLKFKNAKELLKQVDLISTVERELDSLNKLVLKLTPESERNGFPYLDVSDFKKLKKFLNLLDSIEFKSILNSDLNNNPDFIKFNNDLDLRFEKNKPVISFNVGMTIEMRFQKQISINGNSSIRDRLNRKSLFALLVLENKLDEFYTKLTEKMLSHL